MLADGAFCISETCMVCEIIKKKFSIIFVVMNTLT